VSQTGGVSGQRVYGVIAVEEGCGKTAKRCHFDLIPFRGRVNSFRWPQARSAFHGNRLNPKRKVFCVIRNREAGDFGASRISVLCLTSHFQIRGMWCARVSPYAIGTGCQKASLRSLRTRRRIRYRKHTFMSLTRAHQSSPHGQKHRNNPSQTSLPHGGGGKTGTYVSRPLHIPDTERKSKFRLDSMFGPVVFMTILYSGRKPPLGCLL